MNENFFILLNFFYFKIFDNNFKKFFLEQEIESGHVDNTNSELSIDKFTSQTIEELQSIRTKLLNLLDVIETNLKTEIAQNEKNEADANKAVADFQIKIETENH